VNYQELRERHIANLMDMIPEQLARLSWSRERIAAEREARLRDLVGIAKQRSPWHAKRLAHVDADRLGEADLASIPPMTKCELMANWDDAVTDRRLSLSQVSDHLERLEGDAYLLDHYHACASGGSTGTRGTFVYDWNGWALAWLGGIRHLLREDGFSPGSPQSPRRTAFVGSDHPSHMGAGLGVSFGTAGGAERLHLELHQPMAKIVAQLNGFQPNCLLGYPSALQLLAEETLSGRLRIAPERVGTGAEPLLPEAQEAMERAWGAPVADIWGSSEVGLAAFSPRGGRPLLLDDDLVILEPVDAEGRPVPVGVCSAKIYVTNLFNYALPIIRYEITDEVTLLDAADPRGSGHRMIAPVQGRQDDLFVYRGGVTVHPHVFRSLLGRERRVLEYQVRQTRSGASIRLRATGPLDLAGLEARIEQTLAAIGVAAPEVWISAVQRIERTATGKLRRFVPLAGGLSTLRAAA
jgi:phenylacetate-coenzyme A ligase PaaK-like adenylate-forming protein